MARTTWKQVERDAAAAIGATRYWANAGEREDIDSPYFAAQVKNRRSLSLNELGLLVEEMTVRGLDRGKIPVVFVKQSARRPTQLLAVMPAEMVRMFRVQLIDAGEPLNNNDVRTAVKAHLKELPGMRKRVAEFVEKSKAKARRPARKPAREVA